MKILFQGDSVTDCGRSREDDSYLGQGYANVIASTLSAKFPDINFKFVNKGVSGNRTVDLIQRWQEDCIDIKPDILTILIGINDVWRKYDNNIPMTAEEYESNYRKLLDWVKKELPNTKIVILEPFVLPTTADRIVWREDLDPKIQAVRRVAKDFGAKFIPLDGIFSKLTIETSPEKWASDGVHPTSAGHGVIADYVENEIIEMIMG